eukprot:7324292-Pyramimonas_sp.AAC.1
MLWDMAKLAAEEMKHDGPDMDEEDVDKLTPFLKAEFAFWSEIKEQGFFAPAGAKVHAVGNRWHRWRSAKLPGPRQSR